MKRWLVVSMSGFLLAGCIVPQSLRVASWAVDGLTYIATDKSVMDHSLSALSGRDCKVLRLASAKAICLEEPPGVDFDGGLAARDGGLVAEIKACDLPDIVQALPDRANLNQCADTLVDRFGQPGAVSYSDWHITQLIDAGHTDDAGVWFGIRAAVQGTAPDRRG